MRIAVHESLYRKYMFGLSKERPILGDHPKAHKS